MNANIMNVYKPILIKNKKNTDANVMKAQIFHLIKYDLKGQ